MRSGLAIALAAVASTALASVPDHPDMASCKYHPNMFHEFGKGPEPTLSDAPGIRYYTNKTDPLAVSLDGSSGAYYFRPGTQSTKWYIHHMGGVSATRAERRARAACSPATPCGVVVRAYLPHPIDIPRVARRDGAIRTTTASAGPRRAWDRPTASRRLLTLAAATSPR